MKIYVTGFETDHYKTVELLLVINWVLILRNHLSPNPHFYFKNELTF